MLEILIDVKEAPKIFKIMDEKILEHLLRCSNCRPGVRCIQYMSLKGIQDNLKWVEVTNGQKN